MLVFPEELALHTVATPEQMNVLVNGTLSVTRLQRASLTAGFLEYAGPEQQVALTEQILARMRPTQNPASYVCILDTGVRRAHPLLMPLLLGADCHAYRPAWGTDDHDDHGTLMGGLASLGDLTLILNSNDMIEVPFHLESVKIYPPIGENPHELLGAITQGGIARAEIAVPERKRVFCLASSTSDDSPHHGKPSSWAAELDQLCVGLNQEPPLQRLICVSAGNLSLNPYNRDRYVLENDLAEVESPGQAWNALTVGAYTDKVEIVGNGREGWMPLAPRGDLSPTSRTSIFNWESQWPSKPEIVLEGGNLGVDPADNHALGVDSLALLSTSRHFPNPYFQTLRETSAATALASRICASVQSEYPALWPETIRALVVNSAEWTPAMLARLPAIATKAQLREFLGRYGYGVPNGERALWSKRNALTLVAEDALQPFAWSARQAKLNQMKTFSLPWPREALQALEAENVSMKVTLSYFIEPNPSETARNRNSRYASHGLRFAVKVADEEDGYFQKRINKLAREEGETVQTQADDGWMLGSQLRSKGSLHQDIWKGPASDLARRGIIAVFPVSGWWKDRPHLEKVEKVARFSLVVSIQTPQIETDIYTPVTNLIPIPV
jgi:subtilase family protein